MKIKPLFGVTYIITPDNSTAVLNGNGLKGLLKKACELLEREYGIVISDRELSAEQLFRADGSSVIIASRVPEPCLADSFFACDVSGSGNLGALCRALTAEGLHLSEEIGVYVGSTAECYRLILINPSERAAELCGEFGELCEITELFAAQTAENLPEAACGEEIKRLGEVLY